MEDFQIQHNIEALFNAFGVKEASSSDFAEYLLKNQTQYVSSRMSSHAALKKLAEQSSDSKILVKKHQELQSRNFRELGPTVYLLDNISSVEQVQKLLIMPSVNGASDKTKDNERLFSTQHQKKRASSSKIDASDSPCEFPKWVRERKHFTWDFNCYLHDSDGTKPIRVGPIGALPRETQEQLLINNILFCMQGVDGDYIVASNLRDLSGCRMFHVDQSADRSLLEMTKRIVPLFSDYSTIISFIEEKTHFEHGLVNHALCAAMRDLLKDYFLLIPQLEQQKLQNKLTLQHIWFYIRPTMLKMKAIADIARAIDKDDCFGGAVLSLLHKRASSLIGDKETQDICYHFAQSASVPYFEVLEKWIYKGIISDPYSEFLVVDNELAQKEESPVEYSSHYWEKRYIIRRDNVPIFLENVADMILRTGKYLNVVRQCGHDIRFPHDTTLKYVIGEQSYKDKIETAYQFASKKLLDLLLDENDLRGRLRSVKHYFLLDKGDFLIQFMDMAEEELVKDIDDVMPTRLETLLELALRSSAVNSDKYKDDVRIVFLPELLQSQLFMILNVPSLEPKVGSATDSPTTGIEALVFDYEVKWPLSLILNREAISSYQVLFRQLFSCKHIERLLGRVWNLYKKTNPHPRGVVASFPSAFALCQRMLNFIQNLDYYFTLEVIEPNWQYFLYKISQVSNVDEVLQCHENFLSDCVYGCMLGFPDLLKVLSKLFRVCVAFCNFMEGAHKNFVVSKAPSVHNGLLAPLYEDSPLENCKNTESTIVGSFSQKISDFHGEFNSVFVLLLDMISNAGSSNNFKPAKMLNMLCRLDFGGFYTKNTTSASQQESTAASREKS